MKYQTRDDLPEDYVQKSKEDWWKCSYCKKFHKGFPYRCPLLTGDTIEKAKMDTLV